MKIMFGYYVMYKINSGVQRGQKKRVVHII